MGRQLPVDPIPTGEVRRHCTVIERVEADGAEGARYRVRCGCGTPFRVRVGMLVERPKPLRCSNLCEGVPRGR